MVMSMSFWAVSGQESLSEHSCLPKLYFTRLIVDIVDTDGLGNFSATETCIEQGYDLMTIF
jgi:hypothetical protein